MAESSQGKISPFLSQIRKMVKSVHTRIEAIKCRLRSDQVVSKTASLEKLPCDITNTAPIPDEAKLPTKPLRHGQQDAAVDYRAAAVAFRHAVAVGTAMYRSQPADEYENKRLAIVFGSGRMSLIAAEPELTGATMLVELAIDFFDAGSRNNDHPAQVGRVISALRNLIAEEISRGVWPELKPAFKQEYVAFHQELIARSRAGAGRL